LEAELKDLRIENEQMRGVNNRLEQELLCQQRMGVQIQEIIQFVADGKERQELLQDVTSRLAGELESFKRGLSIQAPPNNVVREQQQSNGSYANTPTSIIERFFFCFYFPIFLLVLSEHGALVE